MAPSEIRALSTNSPRVIVAHPEVAIRESAVSASRKAGYEVIGVGDGDSVVALLGAEPVPAALVVDAGLPGRAGYELCEEITARGLGTKVILIASVYSKTAYKRRPSGLYGADDYVEQHHVVDMLAPKLAQLVPPPTPPREIDVHELGNLSPEQKREVAAIRVAGEGRLEGGGDAEIHGEEAVAMARKLARLIVADLVLYNGAEIEQWLGDGPVPESFEAKPLPDRLKQDLDEGRRLLSVSSVKDSSRSRDFIGEAFLELLTRKGAVRG